MELPSKAWFGFTTIPSSWAFKYTFENLASTIVAFVDPFSLSNFAMFVSITAIQQAYNLPCCAPEAVTASQNGNAYVKGSGEFLTNKAILGPATTLPPIERS
ncbi:hypothetical protein V1517DRAFT_328827 [Lipomyces orientalis]|uniref:Uncharacterized protein n=1 Tax=Lipomyces orientalis TaxID=1233043 RepID=A0ACC3THC5_9ASCO